jgi:hypothetical protein
MAAPHKRRLAALDLALFILFLASVGMTWGTIRSTRSSVEGLVASPGEVVLGEVEQIESIPFEVRLQNQGQQRVVISEVIRPCSCTGFDLEVGTTLKPGRALRVLGSVDTTNRRGPYEPAFAVSYRFEDGPQEYTLTLPVKMDIKPSVAATPESLVVSEGSWSLLDLSPGTAQRFRIQDVEPSDPFIIWEAVESQLGQECESFRLRLQLDPALLPLERVDPNSLHWVTITTSIVSEPKFRVPIVLEIPEGRGQATE